MVWKKKSIGLYIFMIFLVLYGICVAGLFGQPLPFNNNPLPNVVYSMINITIVVIFCALITGIFRLKNWARLGCIWGSMLFIAWSSMCIIMNWRPIGGMGLGEIIYGYPYILGIPTIIYLTRPKVKERFKQ